MNRMHKIAGKLAKKLRKDNTKSVISLDAYKAFRQAADETIASLKHAGTLIDRGYHPVHAYYIQTQNVLSVIIEELLLFKELDRFTDIIGDAEDEYMPGGPPMSPISTSFFTSWSSFDVAVGLQKETLTSIVIDLKPVLKLSSDIVVTLTHFSQSRMGIYEHMGFDRENIVLRDIVTQQTYNTFNTSGYRGSEGEVWFVRLLPSLGSHTEDAIGFTSPYILRAGLDAWAAFFERLRRKTHKQAVESERLMKYGLSPCYWLEYIHQAYLGINVEATAIFLDGVPDKGKTRPHYSDSYSSRLPEYQEGN